MPYLGIFGLEFLKTIVIFEISTLEFVKHESLTHTINFGIGSAFSKGLRSAFSEGLGLGPLYKACHLCVVLLFIATILGWFLYCSIDLAIGSSI